MNRFVILRHEVPECYERGLHWDLMLEMGGALRTWSMPEALGGNPESSGKAPSPCPLPEGEGDKPTAVAMQAIALADHRVEYLEYEGPVSGNRGSVTRVEHGQYHLRSQSADELVAMLEGQRLRGELTLERASGGDHRWRLSFLPAPMTGA